jgi:FlaA1/EpsC-like NDP-sugar epimerase
VSRVEPRYSLDAFVRCKVHHVRATLLRERDGVVWGAGPVGKSFARELLAQGTPVAAFVDVDPRKIGHAVYGIPVVAVEDERRFADAVALGAVSGEEGRRRVREVAAAAGRVEGFDFVAVA